MRGAARIPVAMTAAALACIALGVVLLQALVLTEPPDPPSVPAGESDPAALGTRAPVPESAAAGRRESARVSEGDAGQDRADAGRPWQGLDEPRRARMLGFVRPRRQGSLAGRALRVRIVAGLDAGHEFDIRADGLLDSGPLWPGRARYRLLDGEQVLAEREIVLRDGGGPSAVSLQLEDQRPLQGSVVDESGQPIGGAVVRCDGQRVRADAKGEFTVLRRVAGTPPVRVTASGHAPTALPAWSGPGRRFVLGAAARLRVDLDRCTGRDAASLQLMAAEPRIDGGRGLDRFDRQPVWAGERVVFEDLPPLDVLVVANLPTHRGVPVVARLRAGETVTVRVRWEPRALVDGLVRQIDTGASSPTAAGARVRLHVHDVFAVLSAELGDAAPALFARPFPMPAFTSVSTSAAADGSFSIRVPALGGEPAWLEVQPAAGAPWRQPIPRVGRPR